MCCNCWRTNAFASYFTIHNSTINCCWLRRSMRNRPLARQTGRLLLRRTTEQSRSVIDDFSIKFNMLLTLLLVLVVRFVSVQIMVTYAHNILFVNIFLLQFPTSCFLLCLVVTVCSVAIIRTVWVGKLLQDLSVANILKDWSSFCQYNLSNKIAKFPPDLQVMLVTEMWSYLFVNLILGNFQAAKHCLCCKQSWSC